MHKMEFDPKRFLRRLRPEIKERLLGQLTLLDLMNKNRCEEDPEPDRDYFAWMRIPEDRRKTSSRDLARINDMCSDKARFYLMQEAHVLWRSKPDLLQEATEMPTCDLAATLFLESEINFKRAWSEFYIDDFAFRIKRKGKDDSQPKVSAGTKDRLQRRIQLFYKAGGEGHRHCKVEDHDDENRFAIFLYHEHRVRYREKFDENGILLSEEDKPVEQAMAVYYKHTHVVTVNGAVVAREIGAANVCDPSGDCTVPKTWYCGRRAFRGRTLLVYLTGDLDPADDGAYSGATLVRPALQQLLADVRAGRIDTIVVYKIDRLSRSLMDFTKLVGELEQYDVTLVAVTQQFNTTTSMGRLTLNILLSFAQFEREVCAERIRDKIAAEKRRGRYLGGVPPLGYDVDRERKLLLVNPDEAALVRLIFRRFLQLGSVVTLIKELNEKGHTTKSWTTKKGRVRPGIPWCKNHIYRLLSNPILIGLIPHKDKTFPGQHEAIIEKTLWDEVQESLSDGGQRARANATRSKTPAMLKGVIRCGHCGASMGITFTRKNGRTYRYYLCERANKSGYDACPVKSVPAGDVEKAVMMQVRRVFQAPEILVESLASIQKRELDDQVRLGAEREALHVEIATTKTNAQRLISSHLGGDEGGTFVSEEITRMERTVEALNRKLQMVTAELDMLERTPTTEARLLEELQVLDRIWDELFPAERERLIRLVVDSLTVNPDGLILVLRADGLGSLIAELGSNGAPQKSGATKGRRPKRGQPRAEVDADAGRITLRLPMKFKRKAGRKQVILPGEAGIDSEHSPVQGALAIAMARAHRWLQLLEDGRFASLSELAEAVDMDPSQVRRHLNLTLLSPSMVRQVLDGSEPEGWSVNGLSQSIPVSWGEQGAGR